MLSEPFLPYARQNISPEDLEMVGVALSGELITRGPFVEAFENGIAEYCNVKYAISFNSGSTALAAAYFAAEVNPYDRLLTTPNTYIATAGAAMLRGASPLFVDIDLKTGNVDLELLKVNLEQFSLQGRYIIAPVHFAGRAVDIQVLESYVSNPETVIIEDAAHAIGSLYPSSEKVGSCCFSQMTIFSFHPAKTLTTGEGGMVTTNDEHFANRLRAYRNNGIERQSLIYKDQPAPWYYECQSITGNFHLTDFQAALGLSQLKRLDTVVEKRRKLIAAYREALNGLSLVSMLDSSADSFTANHLAVVLIDFAALKTTRSELMDALKAKGIGSQLHYIPVYRHPVIRDLAGDVSAYFPAMEEYYSKALSLPLYDTLDKEDVLRVVNALKEILSKK